MNIYLASSWRNKLQAEVLAALRLDGHTVYDFKNPAPDNTGFSWREIGDRFGQCKLCGEQDPLNKPRACPVRVDEAARDPRKHNAVWGKFGPNIPAADVMLPHLWEGGWDAAYFATEVLDHPVSAQGFEFDMAALDACSACVLIEPCGRSAHLELGYAVGQGKLTIVYFPELDEPELMIRMCDYVCPTLEGVRRALTNNRPSPRWQRDVAKYDAQFRPNGDPAKLWYDVAPPTVIARDTYAAVDERIGPCRPYLHRICQGCGECWRHRRCTCTLEKRP